MEERNFYTVSQVADMLKLPASMIRYWDDQGLIHSTRHPENDYRLFSLEDVILISDIDFYRKLGTPVKQIKDLESKTVIEKLAILDKTEDEMKKQMVQLQLRQEQLQRKKRQITHLIELDASSLRLSNPTISQINKVDLTDNQVHQSILKNPARLGFLLDESGKQLSLGYAVTEPAAEIPHIWQKSSENVDYYEFLLEIGQEEQMNIETIRNDIISQGYQPGNTAGYYLMSAADPKTASYVEYYHAWIEVETKVFSSENQVGTVQHQLIPRCVSQQ
ncbi:MerR family transcriptional regulator [Enterococcus sp. LJL128]